MKTGRLLTLLLALFMVTVIFTGCGSKTVEGVQYEKNDKGQIVFVNGSDNWTYEKHSGSAIISRNGQVVLNIERNAAKASLPEGIVTVNLTDGAVKDVTIPFGMIITAEQYTLLSTALEYNRLASQVKGDTPWFAIILMVLLIVGGILIEIYSGKLVHADAFDPNGRASRKLTTLRISAGVVILLSFIVFLVLVLA